MVAYDRESKFTKNKQMSGLANIQLFTVNRDFRKL